LLLVHSLLSLLLQVISTFLSWKNAHISLFEEEISESSSTVALSFSLPLVISALSALAQAIIVAVPSAPAEFINLLLHTEAQALFVYKKSSATIWTEVLYLQQSLFYYLYLSLL
ncbi:hypothetical protein CISG_10319, partial [Coccidioides immitis RMSCC 3703]